MVPVVCFFEFFFFLLPFPLIRFDLVLFIQLFIALHFAHVKFPCDSPRIPCSFRESLPVVCRECVWLVVVLEKCLLSDPGRLSCLTEATRRAGGVGHSA